jgi:hypothetical protein
MGLETADWISELVATNPASGDDVAVGDNHLRLLKEVLQSSFPNVDRAQYFKRHAAKSGSYSVLAADMAKWITVDGTGGAYSMTLPTLAAGDDGWSVTIMKTDSSANAVTVVGTINGEANLSLTKQYDAVECVWTGTAWRAFFGLRKIAGVATFVDVDVLATLDVTGAATFASTLALTGNLAINTNKFNVTAASGNTAIAGTLAVTGATSLTADLAINTNKFTVAAASGNTAIAGTLAVTGASTLTGATTVTGALTANNAAGIDARNTIKAAGKVVNGTLQSGSFNVASVTDTGSEHDVVFTTAMANANYIITLTLDATNANESITLGYQSPTTTGFTINGYVAAIGPTDPDSYSFTVVSNEA